MRFIVLCFLIFSVEFVSGNTISSVLRRKNFKISDLKHYLICVKNGDVAATFSANLLHDEIKNTFGYDLKIDSNVTQKAKFISIGETKLYQKISLYERFEVPDSNKSFIYFD
jgi:hypothetical protein